MNVNEQAKINVEITPQAPLNVTIGECAKMDCERALNYIKSGEAEIEKAVQEGIDDFNENASDKTSDFDDNATQKTNAFNQNAEQKQALVDEAAAEAKQWAIGDPEEPEGGSSKYWANQASSELSTLESDVSAIQAVIPAQASSSNQLADKSFVNSSIATNTAYFIGTFNSVAELEAYSGTLTNNDYAFVKTTDTAGNTLYDRYKWNGSEWLFEYELNNSSFTAAQWAAINSGATAEKLADYVTTNTAQTITSQKTFSSAIRRSSTIEQSATTGSKEVRFLDELDSENQSLAYWQAGRSTTTNSASQRISNKNVSGANWASLNVSANDAGQAWASINCGSGLSNRSVNEATTSQSSNIIATMGWVNNPSTSTNVVHRSGNETITGQKEFRDGIKINNTGSTTYGIINQLSNGKVDLYCVGSDGNWSQNYIEMNPSYETVVRGATNVQLLGTTPATTNQSPTEDTTASTQIDTVGARNTKLQDYATTAYVDAVVGAVHIVETGHNGTEWYRVWSDGWCEQGGTVGTGTTSGYPSYTIQLTKEYADTNFNVQVTGRYTSDTNNGTNYCSARTTSSITIRSVGYGSDWVTRGYIS